MSNVHMDVNQDLKSLSILFCLSRIRNQNNNDPYVNVILASIDICINAVKNECARLY